MGQTPESWFVTTEDTDYCLTDPYKATAPDGMFPPGTKVKLLNDGDFIWLVETAEGIKAHVGNGTLRPVDESE